MPKRWVGLRVLYSMPITESTLPTKTEVLPFANGSHSSCARSTSNESPSRKSVPVRGVKFTLDVNSARSPRPAWTPRLSSLTRKLGLPFELIEVEAVDAGCLAEVGHVAPRVHHRGEEVTVEHPRDLRVVREHPVAGIAAEAGAVALRGEEAEIAVARDLDRESRTARLSADSRRASSSSMRLASARACASGSTSTAGSFRDRLGHLRSGFSLRVLCIRGPTPPWRGRARSRDPYSS